MFTQAAIVAGGRGVRMGALTDSVPKPMLPIGGKPILEHLIRWLRSYDFGHAFLCLGYRGEQIIEHFGEGSKFGLRLEYQVEAQPRGTAGCVKDLGSKVRGDLVVVYGDLYCQLDLHALLEYHRSHDGLATLVVRESDHPHDSDLVRTDGDRITGFYRAKKGEPFENQACAALWVIRPKLLERIPADRPSDFGREVFPAAAAAGEKLYAYRTKEVVADIGTPERIEAFERRWSAKK